MSILLSIQNLSLSFGEKVIFRDTQFEILEGDRIGLLGLNGKGKSSLFKIITKELGPDISTPECQFDTVNLPSKADLLSFLVPQQFPFPKERELQTIESYYLHFYPELKTIHLELKAIETQLNQGKHSERLIQKQKDLLEEWEARGGWTISQSYESYLKFFGIYEFSKTISAQSGGQQRRILLAIGLSSPAKIILWDEPTNHLDLETIELFEEELKECGKTFLMITHDRYLLSKICSKIFHIKQGKIQKFKGSYVDYLEHLKDAEEMRKRSLAKLKNTMRRETEWMRQGIKARGTRSKKRVEEYHNLSDKITELKQQEGKRLSLEIASTGKKQKKLLETFGLSFSHGEAPIIDNLTTTLYRGDKIGLLGPNGVGKTTLLKLLSEELIPLSGEIRKPKDISVHYFSQTRDELDESLTPTQLLSDGTDHVNLPGGRQLHVNGYLSSFMFDSNDFHRPISSLSGGEKNRLQLALNLTKEADLWIFDEPTNDLDLETLGKLESILSDFKGTVIIVSHDRNFLANTTNKVWLLETGHRFEVFETGYDQAGEFLKLKRLEEAYKEQEVKETPTPQESKKAPEKKKKLTYKQKEYLKKLPSLIEETELKIEQFEEEISSFDFGTNTKEIQEQYATLSKTKEELEENLLQMYEDQEELSAIDNK